MLESPKHQLYHPVNHEEEIKRIRAYQQQLREVQQEKQSIKCWKMLDVTADSVTEVINKDYQRNKNNLKFQPIAFSKSQPNLKCYGSSNDIMLEAQLPSLFELKSLCNLLEEKPELYEKGNKPELLEQFVKDHCLFRLHIKQSGESLYSNTSHEGYCGYVFWYQCAMAALNAKQGDYGYLTSGKFWKDQNLNVADNKEKLLKWLHTINSFMNVKFPEENQIANAIEHLTNKRNIKKENWWCKDSFLQFAAEDSKSFAELSLFYSDTAAQSTLPEGNYLRLSNTTVAPSKVEPHDYQRQNYTFGEILEVLKRPIPFGIFDGSHFYSLLRTKFTDCLVVEEQLDFVIKDMVNRLQTTLPLVKDNLTIQPKVSIKEPSYNELFVEWKRMQCELEANHLLILQYREYLNDLSTSTINCIDTNVIVPNAVSSNEKSYSVETTNESGKPKQDLSTSTINRIGTDAKSPNTVVSSNEKTNGKKRMFPDNVARKLKKLKRNLTA